MQAVRVAHREATDWSDWVALGTVRIFRWGMDFATGYKHPGPGEAPSARFKMTEKKWMARFIFLESVAGVPGMVGGMLRHLRSLRRMKRDNGWYAPTDPTIPEDAVDLSYPPPFAGLRHFWKRRTMNACTC